MTIGIVVVAFLAARAAGVVVVIIRSALSSNHLGCKLLEPLWPALRIPAFNNDVLPLDVPEFPEVIEQWLLINDRGYVCNESDPPCLARVLRARRERPRRCRTTDKRNKIAPLHVDPKLTTQHPIGSGEYFDRG